jgi:hypothetical protein
MMLHVVVPTLGMLCGNTISGMVVTISSILRDLELSDSWLYPVALNILTLTRENSDKIEMQLAFGASRFEAVCLSSLVRKLS